MQLEVIKNSVKPPLAKRELIMATAIAMERKASKAYDDAQAQRQKAIQTRNAYIRKIAGKHLSDCEAEVRTAYHGEDKSKLHVTLRVAIDDPKLRELETAIWHIPLPMIRSAETIRKELESAARGASDRTKQILAQPGVSDALAKAGEAVLAGKAVDV